MKKSLVSILIPNYNYDRYLRECLDSVLAQTYDNFEVIISDNRSTDNSYDTISCYKMFCKIKGISEVQEILPYAIAGQKESISSGYRQTIAWSRMP